LAAHTTSKAHVTVAVSATDALDFLKRAPETYPQSEPLDRFEPFLPRVELSKIVIVGITF
jgi:hypothetical protein